jgi:4a-hydroxytetrahydrobiopterin dehydratase
MSLADRAFVPCTTATPRLDVAAIESLHRELGNGWEVVEGHHLRKTFRFPDFAGALAFVNRVGALADQLDHHPDIHLTWGKATIEIWTHTIDGVGESDFIYAARVERLQQT